MIRALIVDDEQHAREELEALLTEIGGFDIVGRCGNAVEAIQVINRLRPEVLFLDIQMPAIDGFQLLSMIDPDRLPRVVFVTAYDEYALKAFEEKAVDYLLKPLEKERLRKTAERLRQTLHQGQPPVYPAAPLERIPCVCAGKIKLIDPGEIEHVRSDLSGVHVVTARGEFFTELTLKVLENLPTLVRCHKQYLVNLARVDEIDPQEGGLARIRTHAGHLIPASRRYLKALKDSLGF